MSTVSAAEVFPLHVAKSRADVVKSATAQFGTVSTQEKVVDDKKLFVLLRDVGSGVSRPYVYVYVGSGSELKLLAFLQTNTSAVTIVHDNAAKSVLIKSRSGTILMAIPDKSLDLAYDPVEQ